MIRIFIGSQCEQWLAAKVLEYSIINRTASEVEMVQMWESNIHVPDRWQKQGATGFTFQRFLSPELCGFEGRSIYLDSDMLLRTDIAELWNLDMGKAKVLATPGWQTAAMLIDNTVGWKIDDLCRQLDDKELTYQRAVNLKFKYVNRTLDPLWNCKDSNKKSSSQETLAKMDRPDAKLLHFTNMWSQPFLTSRHPCGAIWENELQDAVEDGYICVSDVMHEIFRENIRPSLAAVVGEDPPADDSEFEVSDVVRGKGCFLKRKVSNEISVHR